MRSLGSLLDDQAICARKRRFYDVSVIRDVLAETETGRWPGTIEVLHISGTQSRRVLHLGCDSSLALLMSYDLSGILARINPLLGSLAVDEIRLVHRHGG